MLPPAGGYLAVLHSVHLHREHPGPFTVCTSACTQQPWAFGLERRDRQKRRQRACATPDGTCGGYRPYATEARDWNACV